MSKRIAIEFDGVITHKRTFPTIGPLQDNVREVISLLREDGHFIIIHSTRNNISLFGNEDKNLMYKMRDFIEENGVEYDELDDGSKGKPIADIFLSHRNIKFTNWVDFFYRVTYNRLPNTKKRNPVLQKTDDDWVDGTEEI